MQVRGEYSDESDHPVRGFRSPGIGGRVAADATGELICVAGVAAPGRPSAVAVALAVVADAFTAEDLVQLPSR
jgi:hypothetical protein